MDERLSILNIGGRPIDAIMYVEGTTRGAPTRRGGGGWHSPLAVYPLCARPGSSVPVPAG